MDSTPREETVFVTLVGSMRQLGCARLLIDSLRDFGGPLKDCPIWLFETAPHKAPCQPLSRPGVEIFPLTAPASIQAYPLGPKVYACARAEETAAGRFTSMIFAMPECLFIRPPILFDLGPDHDAAVRPVHHTNVGLPVAAPLNPFWERIYREVGVPDVDFTAFSFVEGEPLRAYFNTATFALKTSLGLCRRWLESFEALIDDPEYQAGACLDLQHRIFLHQALLSTMLVSALDSRRIRVLPPDYGYPYNLQDSVPNDRRARVLNDLAHVIYEERSMDPAGMNDIEIREPLRSWLSRHIAPDSGAP